MVAMVLFILEIELLRDAEVEVKDEFRVFISLASDELAFANVVCTFVIDVAAEELLRFTNVCKLVSLNAADELLSATVPLNVVIEEFRDADARV